MDLKAQTIETYNKSAQRLADKFDSQGARKEDIDFVFSRSNKKEPFVFEIGCGNGRDAEKILQHTHRYLGMDISQNLLAIAGKNLPEAQFILGDIATFQIPDSVDIVFAFASLIHVNKNTFEDILERIHASLSQEGLVFISLKHSDQYMQVTKDDEYGTRTYWHYSEKDIRDMASHFSIENINVHDLRGQVWMEVLLRKD